MSSQTRPKMNDLLLEHYGIDAREIKKLNGYDNCNYLISSDRGRYIFKPYAYEDELKDILAAEGEKYHLNSS